MAHPVDQSFKTAYGPWAVVAGGSAGLGAAFADALARRGLDLVLVARRATELQALSTLLDSATASQYDPFAWT